MNAPPSPHLLPASPLDETLRHLRIVARPPPGSTPAPRADAAALDCHPAPAEAPAVASGARGRCRRLVTPRPCSTCPSKTRADRRPRHRPALPPPVSVTEAPPPIQRALHGPPFVRVDDAAFTARSPEDRPRAVRPPVDARDLPAMFASHAATPPRARRLLLAPTDTLLPDMFAAPVLVLLRGKAAGARARSPSTAAPWRPTRETPGSSRSGSRPGRVAPVSSPRSTRGSTSRRRHPRGHALGAAAAPPGVPPHPPAHPLHAGPPRGGDPPRAVEHPQLAARVYNGFPYTTEGMHRMVAKGCDRRRGQRALARVALRRSLRRRARPYGRYRRVARRLDGLRRRDARAGSPRRREGARLADHIAAWLPGFPDGRAIFEDGALAGAVATWLCTVTTFHTGDHPATRRSWLEHAPSACARGCPRGGPGGAARPGRARVARGLLPPRDGARDVLPARGHHPLRDVAYDVADARERRAVARWDTGWTRSTRAGPAAASPRRRDRLGRPLLSATERQRWGRRRGRTPATPPRRRAARRVLKWPPFHSYSRCMRRSSQRPSRSTRGGSPARASPRSSGRSAGATSPQPRAVRTDLHHRGAAAVEEAVRPMLGPQREHRGAARHRQRAPPRGWARA